MFNFFKYKLFLQYKQATYIYYAWTWRDLYQIAREALIDWQRKGNHVPTKKEYSALIISPFRKTYWYWSEKTGTIWSKNGT